MTKISQNLTTYFSDLPKLAKTFGKNLRYYRASIFCVVKHILVGNLEPTNHVRLVSIFHSSKPRTTRIYLDRRVLRPNIIPRPSFDYFTSVI